MIWKNKIPLCSVEEQRIVYATLQHILDMLSET